MPTIPVFTSHPSSLCLVLCINMWVDHCLLPACSCVMRCAQCSSERRCAHCWLLRRHTGDLLLQQRLPALQRADDHSLPARRHLEQSQQDTPMLWWVEDALEKMAASIEEEKSELERWGCLVWKSYNIYGIGSCCVLLLLGAGQILYESWKMIKLRRHRLFYFLNWRQYKLEFEIIWKACKISKKVSPNWTVMERVIK